ncbi:MAG: zinc-binding dehydrogenase [Nitrospirae bacterium]|nr:zinc-binding dehydrogenase [Nitrospirota bacterium]
MKAVRFHEHGGPEVLRYEDAPVPANGPDEAHDRDKACSDNHLDIWIRQWNPAYRLALPHILGCDIAGIVESVGPAITGVAPGQKVVVAPGLSCFRCSFCLSGDDNLCTTYRIIGAQVDGGYAEFAAVPAVNLIPMPDNLSFEQAAAYPLTFMTAWHMLIHRAGLKPGLDVLILAGGSGLGSAAIQIAKLSGARVFTTAGTDSKLERAKTLGADVGIPYEREDFSKKILELTEGRGVDVVFDHIGTATWEKSLASLAKNGKLLTCGTTTGGDVKMNLRSLFMRQQTILGATMGTRAELVEITKRMAIGSLKPVVDSVYPLREARAAQERMLARENFGKIVLVP